MKKILSVILVLVMIFAVGCGDKNAGGEIDTAPENDSQNVDEVEEIPKEDEASEKEVSEEENDFNPDFRNIKWGMNVDEVKKREDSVLAYEDDKGLIYQDLYVAGFDANLFYYFNVNGELYQAIYGFTHDHVNETEFIRDYEDIKEELIEKYGEPIEDEQYWFDDLYKDDPSDWGMAIITGDLTYMTEWVTEDVNVRMLLEGDNFETTFMIAYISNTVSNEAPEKDSGL